MLINCASKNTPKLVPAWLIHLGCEIPEAKKGTEGRHLIVDVGFNFNFGYCLGLSLRDHLGYFLRA